MRLQTWIKLIEFRLCFNRARPFSRFIVNAAGMYLGNFKILFISIIARFDDVYEEHIHIRVQAPISCGTGII